MADNDNTSNPNNSTITTVKKGGDDSIDVDADETESATESAIKDDRFTTAATLTTRELVYKHAKMSPSPSSLTIVL